MEPKKGVTNDNEMAQLWNDAATLVGFIWRSAKRHRAVAVLVFLTVVVLSVVILQIMPRTYESGARILTNPSRTLLGLEPYIARQSSTELITSRENLLAIIKDNKLVEKWESSRTTIGRMKDRVLTAIFGEKAQESDEETLTMILLYMLQNKIFVNMSRQVVEITVQWHDAETAYLIAKTLVQRFLDDQYARENAEYIVNIANFEKRLVLADKELTTAEQRYRNSFKKDETPPDLDSSSEVSSQRQAVRTSAGSGESAGLKEDITELERSLEQTRREIEMLQNSHLERMGEAKNRLAELKTTLGPRHPEVIKQERLVALVSSPPPALNVLRAQRDQLSDQLKKARSAAASKQPIRRRWRASREIPVAPSATEESEVISAEQEELYLEYQQAREDKNRIDGELANAKIEYEAGKAALDLRFKVSQPPSRPTDPVKPDPKKILIAAIVVGIILSIFLVVFIDIRSGILLESWQVSRILGISILGEMDDPM